MRGHHWKGNTVRAVTYVRNGVVEVIDKPIPEIHADGVLVRVGGAGLCHSDLHIIHTGDENPLVGGTLGHEVAGTVEKIGADVSTVAVGDRVLVALVYSCGSCRECLAGRDNLCWAAGSRDTLGPLSPGIGAPGGMAEYIPVKARNIDPIGDLDPVAAAPLADAALTPMHAIETVRDRLVGDATVVVLGLGGLGHLALQLLAATCGSRIVAVDTDPGKLAAALTHGADVAVPSDGAAAGRILELTGGRGADVVLDFVGVQPTVNLALAVIAQGGAIRFVGLGGGSFAYAAATGELAWGVNIERAYGGTRAEMRQIVALAQAGKIAVEVTRYPLDDAARAFADLEAGRVPGRAVLVP